MDHEAIGVECEAIDVDETFAGAWVIDVGHESVDGGDVIVGTHVIDVGCKAVDDGCLPLPTIGMCCPPNILSQQKGDDKDHRFKKGVEGYG